MRSCLGNPTCLPSELSYDLVHNLNRLLEKVCYDFSKQHFPAACNEQGWNAPEKIESYRWLAIVQDYNVPKSAISAKHGEPSLDILFGRLAHLRHGSVHRKDISVNMLIAICEDLKVLFSQLQHDKGVSKIERLLPALVAAKQDIKREVEHNIETGKEELAAIERKINECHRERSILRLDRGRSPRQHLTSAEEGLEADLDFFEWQKTQKLKSNREEAKKHVLINDDVLDEIDLITVYILRDRVFRKRASVPPQTTPLHDLNNTGPKPLRKHSSSFNTLSKLEFEEVMDVP